MRVFNLKPYDLHFRKTILAANGGSRDFPDLDGFIPDSDKQLAEAKVISFYALPRWWVDPRTKEDTAPEAAPAIQAASDNQETAVESTKYQSNKAKKREQYAQKE